MPQFRVELNDREIAHVLTFIRAGWGNGASPVEASQVATLRASADAASDRVIVLKMR